MRAACTVGWTLLRHPTILLALLVPAAVLATSAAHTRQARIPGAMLGTDRIMPSERRRVLPELPGGSVDARVDVDVEVVVGRDGAVLHAHLPGGGPATARDRAVLDAVRRWTFRPAVDASGKPVTVLIIVRLTLDPPREPGGLAGVRAQLRTPERLPVGVPDRAALPSAIVACDMRGLRSPVPIRTVNPSYTSSAMRALVQGIVQLEVVILADGTIGAAKVTRSLDPDLDREAQVAARYWLFEPATFDGPAVACTATLELEFRLH